MAYLPENVKLKEGDKLIFKDLIKTTHIDGDDRFFKGTYIVVDKKATVLVGFNNKEFEYLDCEDETPLAIDTAIEQGILEIQKLKDTTANKKILKILIKSCYDFRYGDNALHNYNNFGWETLETISNELEY